MANPQNKRLTGLNPLAYMGVEPITPPLLVINDRTPTVNDYENFNEGSFWLDSENEDLFILVSKAAGIATWAQLSTGASGSVSGLVADDLNTAMPVAGLINILGGPNIHTAAGGNTLSVALNDAIDLPSTNALFTSGALLINSQRFVHAYGSNNTFLGADSGNGTLTGNDNVGCGFQTLDNLTTGFNNVAVGANSLTTLTTGSGMTAVGFQALANISTATASQGSTAVGSGALIVFTGTNAVALGRAAGFDWVSGASNVIIGDSCASLITSGSNNTLIGNGILGGAGGTATGPISDNIIIGKSAGLNFATTESSNIIIGNAAVATDNNTIRIGSYAFAPGAGQQNKCYIAAAYSNFGTRNTFVGEESGNTTLTIGSSVDNVGVGTLTLSSLTTAIRSTATGSSALTSVTTGNNNCAYGYSALLDVTTGSNNCAFGSSALAGITFTSGNSAFGHLALAIAGTSGVNNSVFGAFAASVLLVGDQNVIAGSNAAISLGEGHNNTIIGFQALLNADGTGGSGGVVSSTIIGSSSGTAYTTNESDNLLINATGVIGDANVMRIGYGTATAGGQEKVFINGIRGITTDNNDAIAVLIDSAGQLGTVSSSRRGKTNIEDMGDASSFVYKLRPVTFSYLSDHSHVERYGLIAEEVEEVNNRLVAYGENGQVESVKYHDLPALLLNELQRLEKRVSELEAQLSKKKCC